VSRSRVASAAFLLLSALGTAARDAAAGGPIGPNGSPIQTSEYAIDLFQGPVFAGSRVTGLAGSYVAISEDVDGNLQNPATPAVRPFFSYSHFDYWLGFGLTFPATLQNMDFFNSGSKTTLTNAPDSFVFFTPSVNLQFGELGMGVSLEMQQYELSGPTDGEKIRVTIPTTHVQVAHGIDHNQWVLGVGARLLSMHAASTDNEATKFKSSGTGLELGAVYKPENRPFRFGVAVRTSILTNAKYSDSLFPNDNGDLVVPGGSGDSYLPKIVALPWDFNFGAAVQIGSRPMNPPWRSIPELIERQILEHRLRQVEREDRMEEDIKAARTSEEKDSIALTYSHQQASDDRALAQEALAAREKRENYLRMMNRSYLQISASMLVTGPVVDAVGVESLLSQVVNRSGQHTVVSPRLGLEWGALPELLKVRGGTYLEPTRFDTSEPRWHATAGLDIKLIKWNVFGLWPDDYMWRLGLGLDASRRYYTWGLTIAGWYPRRGGQPESTPQGAAAPVPGAGAVPSPPGLTGQ
jgi:hypothetical protein